MKRIKKRSFKTLKRRAWKVFSEYIRRRDADYAGRVSCYTCGVRMPWKQSHAGHAIGGRHHAVLFDPDICRPQCYRCNVPMRGQYPIFAAKLIRERGLEWFEAKLSGARRPVKLASADLSALMERYQRPYDGRWRASAPSKG